jgi:hypothetical protein
MKVLVNIFLLLLISSCVDTKVNPAALNGSSGVSVKLEGQANAPDTSVYIGVNGSYTTAYDPNQAYKVPFDGCITNYISTFDNVASDATTPGANLNINQAPPTSATVNFPGSGTIVEYVYAGDEIDINYSSTGGTAGYYDVTISFTISDCP